MRLVANSKEVKDLLAEVLLEYSILEANPFDAASADSGGGDEGGGAEGGGEEKEEEKEKKPKEGGDALTVKIDQSAVKKYNNNTDWKASEAEVKKITKKGLEVDIDGNTILVNFDDITESAKSFFKKKITEETKDIELDSEDKKDIKDLEAEMGKVAKELGAEFDAAQDEIEKEVEETSDEQVNEVRQKLNEVGPLTVIGFVMALPKVVELLAKAAEKIIKVMMKITGGKKAKTEEERLKWAAIIIDFTHKWHDLYIKIFYWILKYSGVYKKAGVKNKEEQMKIAKVLYYVVVAALALAAGLGAVTYFKKASVDLATHTGDLSFSAFEAGMAAIKSGEVAEFVSAIGGGADLASAAA